MLTSFRRLPWRGLAGVVGALMAVGTGYFTFASLDEAEASNVEIKQALAALEGSRDCNLAERRLDGANAAGAPLELNRFVENVSSAVGVEISESSGIAPVKFGRLVRRGVEVKLRKVTLLQLTKFIQNLERAPQVVQVARLSVETRWKQHRDLDVTMVLATYDKQKTERDPRDRARRS